MSSFYPRPVFAFGCCHRLRLCICMSMCVCINHELVRMITHRSFKLGSPNSDQRCILIRSLTMLELIGFKTIAGDRSNQFGLLAEHKFCRKLSIDSRYCSRFLNLGTPIFSLNHSGTSAATVLTIPTTFGIAYARCYTHDELATQSAPKSDHRHSMLCFVNPLRSQNCICPQSVPSVVVVQSI